jgi:hypothetical protein
VNYSSARHIFLALAGYLMMGPCAALVWRGRRTAALPVVLSLILAGQFTAQALGELAMWRDSSHRSRQLAGLLRAGNYERDAVVIIDSAPPGFSVFFWEWGLPFAVEEPFMDFRARLVPPSTGWYCCNALFPSRDTILQEVAAGRVQDVHHIVFNTTTNQFQEKSGGQ